MRSDAELDAMHDAVVARFPGGISPADYRRVVLESADDAGRVYPHSLSNMFHQHSLIIGMFFEGLIRTDSPRNAPAIWKITEAGRAALSTDEVPK